VLIDLQAASELLRDSQPSRIRVEVYVPPRAVLSKPNRMPAVGSLEARETHLLSKLATAEKRLRALSRRSASVCTVLCGTCSPPRPLKAVRQIEAAEKRARSLVMSLDLFKHLIVKTATFGQTGKEPSVLGTVEEKPILEGRVHLLVVLDTGTPRNGFSLGRLNAMVLNPSFL
jgi:hypothetical protein